MPVSTSIQDVLEAAQNYVEAKKASRKVKDKDDKDDAEAIFITYEIASARLNTVVNLFDSGITERECLKCRKKFQSKHKGNFVCKSCAAQQPHAQYE